MNVCTLVFRNFAICCWLYWPSNRIACISALRLSNVLLCYMSLVLSFSSFMHMLSISPKTTPRPSPNVRVAVDFQHISRLKINICSFSIMPCLIMFVIGIQESVVKQYLPWNVNWTCSVSKSLGDFKLVSTFQNQRVHAAKVKWWVTLVLTAMLEMLRYHCIADIFNWLK